MDTGTAGLLQALKALADPVRLRLVALCRRGECSVSELARVTDVSQPRVSQQLRQLCEAGLLERFRDGRRVFYRVPSGSGAAASRRRRLLALLPEDDGAMQDDARRLQRLRASDCAATGDSADADRAIHRAVLDLTVTAPVGDLLDIGCGRGRMLKLLASRARRAVGVDIDADARQLARAELLLAGLPNCSLRQGDMHRLPFRDGEFDTVILDDVLVGARDPVRALGEAKRLLRAGGRLLLLQGLDAEGADTVQGWLAEWCAAAGLRLAPARQVPKVRPTWLLSVALPSEDRSVAA